jgi:serine/threonine protein phosphatase PrpC
LALSEAFAAVEAGWEARVSGLKAAKAVTPAAGITAGSCLTAVLLRGAHVTVANCGDCKVILRRADGTVETLTTDHRCSNEGERRRILERGGFIRNGRVIGVLEPTRTIGDLQEKFACRPGVISAEPDVHVTRLRGRDVPTARQIAATVDHLVGAASGRDAPGMARHLRSAWTATMTALAAATKHGGHSRSQSASSMGAARAPTASSSTAAATQRTARQTALATAAASGAGGRPGGAAAAEGLRAASASSSGVREMGSAAELTPGLALLRSLHAARLAEARTSGKLAAGAGAAAPYEVAHHRGLHLPRGGLHGMVGYAASRVAPSACGQHAALLRPTPAFSLQDAAASAPALPIAFLLAATDGVWDALSESAAAAVVAHALAVFGDPNAAARELCLTARKCGSADDISAVVVWICRPEDDEVGDERDESPDKDAGSEAVLASQPPAAAPPTNTTSAALTVRAPGSLTSPTVLSAAAGTVCHSASSGVGAEKIPDAAPVARFTVAARPSGSVTAAGARSLDALSPVDHRDRSALLQRSRSTPSAERAPSNLPEHAATGAADARVQPMRLAGGASKLTP